VNAKQKQETNRAGIFSATDDVFEGSTVVECSLTVTVHVVVSTHARHSTWARRLSTTLPRALVATLCWRRRYCRTMDQSSAFAETKQREALWEFHGYRFT